MLSAFRTHPVPGAFAVCLLTTLVCLPLQAHVDLANIVTLFMLSVFLTARWLGKRAAVSASFLAVAFFDFFFVPPQISFSVSDAQYLITFAVMLVVGLITAELTESLREQVTRSRDGERRKQSLYTLAQATTGATSAEQVSALIEEHSRTLGYHSRIFSLADIEYDSAEHRSHPLQAQVLKAAIRQAAPVHSQDFLTCGKKSLLIPLWTQDSCQGLIAFEILSGPTTKIDEDRDELVTIATLATTALERLFYVQKDMTSQLEISSEKLRNSVLSALSHDLKTPLTAIISLSEASLINDETTKATLATSLLTQARQLKSLIENILDIAKLRSGKVVLEKEWQLYEDIIANNIKILGSAFPDKTFRVVAAPHMPLVEFDAPLMERAVGNLIDNAGKYSPSGSEILINTLVTEDAAQIQVTNQTIPGKPLVLPTTESGSVMPDIGEDNLGLSICRSIVEAHGGKLLSWKNEQDLIVTCISLPLGTPPEIRDESSGKVTTP